MNDAGEYSKQAIETLQRMWAAGDSCAAIAAAIGRTKNSVLGRVHRMGLAPRRSPIKTAGSGTPQVARDALRAQRRECRATAAAALRTPDAARATAAIARVITSRPLLNSPPSPPAPDPQRLTPGDGCRWPLWDARPQRRQPMPFCDAPRRSRACSFCEEHAARGFDKPALSELQRDRLVRSHG